MFDTFVKELNVQGGGVRAYDAAARAARARIATEPDHAAALLLISFAAQRFVDAYDDQPLTVEAAGEEFAQFSALVSGLDAAYEDGSIERRIAALNAAAASLATPRA